MTAGDVIVGLIVGGIVGLIVYLIGTAFDKSPDNRWAGLAGLIVFLLVFVLVAGVTDPRLT